jgi:hypothetical protein
MTKKAKSELTPEMIGKLAEKGIKSLMLSRKQKQELLTSGLEEIYALHDLQKQNIQPLEDVEVDALMEQFFKPTLKHIETPKDIIWVKLFEKTAKLLDCSPGWLQGSPAFALRGEAQRPSVTIHKEIGRLTLHLELINRADRLADIRLCLTDDSKRDKTSFEAELIKSERCIESITATPGEYFMLSRIELGEYTLRVRDTHGEIVSFQIRMDE